MSRVLLTGATGFIGREVLPLLLAHGHQVDAVARRVPAAGAPAGLVWHEADLLDAEASARLLATLRPELLLHLAWDVEPGRFWTSSRNVAWVEASLALMRAFIAAGGRRAVLAGSCAEYDWGGADRPDGHAGLMHERSTTIAPATLYGVCKQATGLVAGRLAREMGVEFAWGRVFYLYGPHEQPARLVPSIAISLLQGRPVDTSDGRQRRDFMHVADAAGAFVALLESEVEGPVNIASGEDAEVGELVRMIAAAAGHGELLRWGAIARGPVDPDRIVADVGRLREEVGFLPKIALSGGLRETVEWWRGQLGELPPGGAPR